MNNVAVLSLMLFIFALRRAIGTFQIDKRGVKLNVTKELYCC